MLYWDNVTIATLTNVNRDYLWSSLHLDKFRISDSVSERDSEKSIQKNTNDVFVEIQEKISAVFNISGFAIYIKISGIIIVKNYIHKRLNLKVLLNEDFTVGEETSMFSAYQAVNFGYHG